MVLKYLRENYMVTTQLIKFKLINEISFNVPVYYFGTDEIACHIPEVNNWYLEFPEEVTD